MKKSIYAFSLIVGIAAAGCQTPAQKEEKAAEKMQDAKQDMNDAKKEERRELNAEYPAFKTEGEREIDANNDRIAKLRNKLAKTGGTAPLDDARKRKIDDLEKKNADLKASLYGYETERSDWETFKAKWNHDKDDLKQAFKDFGDDLKK